MALEHIKITSAGITHQNDGFGNLTFDSECPACILVNVARETVVCPCYPPSHGCYPCGMSVSDANPYTGQHPKECIHCHGTGEILQFPELTEECHAWRLAQERSGFGHIGEYCACHGTGRVLKCNEALLIAVYKSIGSKVSYKHEYIKHTDTHWVVLEQPDKAQWGLSFCNADELTAAAKALEETWKQEREYIMTSNNAAGRRLSEIREQANSAPGDNFQRVRHHIKLLEAEATSLYKLNESLTDRLQLQIQGAQEAVTRAEVLTEQVAQLRQVLSKVLTLLENSSASWICSLDSVKKAQAALAAVQALDVLAEREG